jgi:hypothetical protein
MKNIILFVLSALTIVAGATAQRDTTVPGLTIYGKLLAVSPTRITIEEYVNDSATSTREVSIIAETLIDGCSLDSVQLGVTTLVVLSPAKIYPPQADFVNFDGCVAHIDVMASVTAITNESIQVVTTSPSSFGQVGTTVELDVFPETQYISCDGILLAKNDIQVGDGVYVRANGTPDNPRAVAVQTLNDCSQVSSAECTFISVADSTMFVLVEGTADTLALKLSADMLRGIGIPGDSSLPIYSCDGSMLRLEDLQTGMQMSVSYLISPRRGLFLQYAFVKENCPISANGTITVINGNVVTVVSYGQPTEVTITGKTDLMDCQRNVITLADLAVGQVVDAYAVSNDNGQYDALRLTILDDCPFSFATGGRILDVSSDAVTIEAIDPVTGEYTGLELQIDRATQIIDCSSMPISSSDIQIGNTLSAYYRTSKGARIADMLILLDPCDSRVVGGFIKQVSEETVTILIDKGELRNYTIDSSSVFTDCQGKSMTLSSANIDQRIEGMVTSSNDGGTIRAATVFVNCLQTSLVSGPVERSNDSIVTVTTPAGSRDVLRAPFSILADNTGMLIEWSALFNGRIVCLVIDASTQQLLRGIVDVACNDHAGPDNNPTMVIGQLTRVADGMLEVATAMGDMQFAITPATQMMDEQRNTLGAESMVPGSAIRIMSRNHTADRNPIASTVVLLSATSVDEIADDAATLTVYPNPASKSVTFGSNVPFETITISNVLGTHIAELRNTTTFDVSSLAPGTYVVSGQRGAQRIVTMMVKR